MDLRSFECPACGVSNQFYLSADDERHLRRCPACDRWLIATEGSGGDERGHPDLRVTDLDDPPECPVDGCTAAPSPDELPAHLIDAHDGSLSPRSK